jgi:hypothetical protein
MAEINSKDINYFKGHTIINPNSRYKTCVHDAVVENVDGVIYTIEKEGVNVEKDTSFYKNFGHLVVKYKVLGESKNF